MSYQIFPSSQFKKDLKLAKRRGYPVALLRDVIAKLAEGEPLAPKFRDHELSGNFRGCRECHVLPDWLLIYEKQEEKLFLYLNRTGTHSDLFQ